MNTQTINQITNTAIEQLALSGDMLSSLDALFIAIKKEVGEHSTSARLANLGSYIASDTANLIDCQASDLNEAMKKHNHQ